jgi:hypothetical protein
VLDQVRELRGALERLGERLDAVLRLPSDELASHRIRVYDPEEAADLRRRADLLLATMERRGSTE